MRTYSSLKRKIVKSVSGLPEKIGHRKLDEKTERDLVATLDQETSFYVRVSNPVFYDGAGTVLVRCFTCGHQDDYRKMDCGHYIPRHRYATRWNLDNLRPQCTRCNCYYEGEHWLFRQGLVNELSEEVVAELEMVAHRGGLIHKDKLWMIDKIKRIRAENKALRKLYGIS